MMDKSGILGEALEELGGIVKKSGQRVVKASFDIVKGTLEQASGRVGEGETPTEEDINKLRTTAEKQKAENLAVTRRNLAAMMAPRTPQEPRPAEKVEGEKQQELQAVQKKEAEKPPPLAVQRAREKVERFRGVSG